MGRREGVLGSGGVEIRELSLRIVFSYNGRQVRETLYLDNKPMPPTPANVKYARRVAAEIRSHVKAGTLHYAEYFPHSSRAQAAEAGTVGDFLDKWHAQLDLKPSTLTTYRRLKDNFWKLHIGHLASTM
ncbi:MAG: putative integrase [Burkholderia sp.]|nr:putative integrase [Burkholderia sp.]